MSINHSKTQFRGLNDPGHDFSAHNYFERFSFEDAIIPGANFTKGTNFSGSNLRKAKFIRTNAIGANFEGAVFNDAEILDSNMEGANFSGTSLREVQFKRTNAIGANFEGAVFNDAEISESHMEGANFTGINLARLQIGDSHMEGANFTGATSHAAHIDRTYIIRTHMEGANFTGANLTRLQIGDSHMEGANFTGAKFSDVHLGDVNLTGVQLDGMVFENTTMARCNFTNVKGITLDMMKDVTFDEVTINDRIFNGNAQDAIREMYSVDLLWNERMPLAQFVDAVGRAKEEQDASDMVPNDITSASDGSNPDMLKLVDDTLSRRSAILSVLQYLKPKGMGKNKSKKSKKSRKSRKLKKTKKTKKRKSRTL